MYEHVFAQHCFLGYFHVDAKAYCEVFDFEKPSIVPNHEVITTILIKISTNHWYNNIINYGTTDSSGLHIIAFSSAKEHMTVIAISLRPRKPLWQDLESSSFH
jgi:hypothetical protein